VAGLVVLAFAILSINGGIVLQGSFYTLQNLWAAAKATPEELAGLTGKLASIDAQGKQAVTINVMSSGYNATASTLRIGVPVKLSLVTQGTQGCTRAFTIPSMNLTKTLSETGTEVVEFTPTKAGRLSYACGMGMYTGTFTVIN
jgi:hypothetical protein